MRSSVLWLVLVCAAILAGVLPALIRPALIAWQVVDAPNHRSSHLTPTVRGVGLAQSIATVVAALGLVFFSGWNRDSVVIAMIMGVALAASAIGLADDLRAPAGLRPVWRLVLQGAVGVAATALISAIFPGTWWLLGLGVLGIVGYINVANFMDGINGISGLHGLVTGLLFAAVGYITGREWLLIIGFWTAVAFLAFLPWNLGRVGAFLGDVGSYLLGGLVGATALAALLSGLPVLAVVGPVTIYLADAIFTVCTRLLRGDNILQAHRDHVYQRLVDGGVGHVATALLANGLGLITGVLSLATVVWTNGVVTIAVAIGIIGVVAGYMCLPLWIGNNTKG